MWGNHIVVYHLAVKRNEEMVHATTLETIMLSEQRQSPEITYYVIPLSEVSRVGKFIEDRKRINACLGPE